MSVQDVFISKPTAVQSLQLWLMQMLRELEFGFDSKMSILSVLRTILWVVCDSVLSAWKLLWKFWSLMWSYLFAWDFLFYDEQEPLYADIVVPADYGQPRDDALARNYRNKHIRANLRRQNIALVVAYLILTPAVLFQVYVWLYILHTRLTVKDSIVDNLRKTWNIVRWFSMASATAILVHAFNGLIYKSVGIKNTVLFHASYYCAKGHLFLVYFGWWLLSGVTNALGVVFPPFDKNPLVTPPKRSLTDLQENVLKTVRAMMVNAELVDGKVE